MVFETRALLRTAAVLLLAATGLAAAQPGGTSQNVSWIRMTTAVSPPKRLAPAMAYDPVSRRVVLFGGFGSNGYFNDTWLFDGVSWQQAGGSTAPPARAASNMAYDSTGGSLVLFGGFDGSNYLGDTWIWNGKRLTWTKAAPTVQPTPVTGPGLFTDPKTGRVTMFGGYDGQFYRGQTWQWTGSDWLQLSPATAPSGRGAAILANDALHRTAVLFDGLADVNPYNTWIWNGTDWSQQLVSQPPSRYNSGGAYEPHLGGVVIFGGGESGVDLNDTWEWTGNSWTQLAPGTQPQPRESFGIAYDQAVGRIVMFGGINGTDLLGDTWELGAGSN